MESRVSCRRGGAARSPRCQRRTPCRPARCRLASAAGKRRLPRGHGLGPASTERPADCPTRRPWHGSSCSVRPGSARSLRRLGDFFGCPCAVLVSSHNGTIDHGVFVVRVRRQYLEDSLPNPALRPTTMTCVHLLPIPEPPRQIPPRNARPIAIEDRLDEQPIILCGRANRAFTAGKQVFNPSPLVIRQAVAVHRSASESADPLGIRAIPTWESPN